MPAWSTYFEIQTHLKNNNKYIRVSSYSSHIYLWNDRTTNNYRNIPFRKTIFTYINKNFAYRLSNHASSLQKKKHLKKEIKVKFVSYFTTSFQVISSMQLYFECLWTLSSQFFFRNERKMLSGIWQYNKPPLPPLPRK